MPETQPLPLTGLRCSYRLRRLRVPLLLGMLAATAAAAFSPALSFDQGPGRVEVAVRPGLGGTVFDVPPFGTVSAPTHFGPATARIRLVRIDIDRAAELSDTERSELVDGLASSLARSVAAYVAVTVLVAAALAALLAAATRHRSTGRIVAASGCASLSVLITCAWALAGFDPSAFERPRYTGALVEAPETWQQVSTAVDNVASIRGRLDAVASQIETLWDVTPSATDTIDILHVSDIHLNPVGLAWTEELAARFQVDAVVDTGDITSFGLQFESGVLDRLYQGIGVPYMIAFGNHDSAENRAALSKLFEPIGDKVADVNGLRILGFDDPTFTATGDQDPSSLRAELEAARDRLAGLCRRHRPDIIAVHNPLLASAASGCAPLVISGHTHLPSAYELGSGSGVVRVAVAGSTGAGGIGQVVDHPLYEASLLHFTSDGELTAVDRITLEPSSGEFTITRVPAGRFNDRPPLWSDLDPKG